MGTWNINDLTKHTGAPLPVNDACAGYAFEAQDTQHVMYNDGNGDIHELWWDYNDGWQWHNISQLAVNGAQPAATDAGWRLGIASGAIAGYALDAQNVQHVIYRGSDNHIYDLRWDHTFGWETYDLTGVSGAPPAAGKTFINEWPYPGGDPAAYVFDAKDSQHVLYRAADNHIYELWASTDDVLRFHGQGRANWSFTPLTKGLGAPPACPGGQPYGYAFNSQNTMHVIYTADTTDGAGPFDTNPVGPIFELYWDNGWNQNNITDRAGAPSLPQGDPIGYAFEADGTQHVLYVDADGSGVKELWWDNNGWHPNDLSSPPGLPPETSIDYVSGAYVFHWEDTQHIITVASTLAVGVAERFDLYELWGQRQADPTGWNPHDLTQAVGMAGQNLGCLAAYAFNSQGTQHVICVNWQDPDPHIYELVWS